MEHVIARLTIRMIKFFQGDQRRVHHALKVHSFCSVIARQEELNRQEQFILEAAALLHDIGIPRCEEKYNSTAGHYQELEGPPIARNILEEFSLSEEERERILFLIGHHHTYKSIDKRDYQILVEADFLVNMYEDKLESKQIEAMGRSLFKTETGLALLRELTGLQLS